MFATSIIQPIDMIKVIIQLKSEESAKLGPSAPKANFSTAFNDILSRDGIRGFYRGLDSALTRQLFYTTTRLGAYKTLSEEIQKRNKEKGKKPISFF